nr:MAG TPA: hypothetical protein [Caudoviricetes sp.]
MQEYVQRYNIKIVAKKKIFLLLFLYNNQLCIV